MKSNIKNRTITYTIVGLSSFLLMNSFAWAQSGNLEQQKQGAMKIAEKNFALVKEVGSTVWTIAEKGLNEYRSAKYLEDKLERIGFKVERGVAGFPTAFIATYGSGSPTIGLLAEYDALPGLSSVKEGENGHACGHNLYCAGAVGAAATFKECMDKYNIKATIKVFGSPAEETFDGKAWMAKQGYLKGVDVFFGCHADNLNNIPFKSSLAMDDKIYTFRGTSAHAAKAPQKGISALDALEIMNVAGNYLREHIAQDVRMHYVITKGGRAPNVVPDEAQSEWYIRAPEGGVVADVSQKLDNCAKAGCLATGATYEVELVTRLHNFIPNKAGVTVAYENLKLVGAPAFDSSDQKAAQEIMPGKQLSTKIEELPQTPGLFYASSDEGDVSWHAPLINFLMAVAPMTCEIHTIGMTKSVNSTFAYKAQTQNVKVMVCTGLELIAKPEILKKIQQEFADSMKTRVYDPGKQMMLELKYFPEPPGVSAKVGNSVRFFPQETIFDESTGMVVNVYRGTEKIGSLKITDPKNTYTVTSTVSFKATDVLTIKFQPRTGNEIVYGYVKKM